MTCWQTLRLTEMGSKAKFYCQCKLHKKAEEGVRVLVTWLPESKAVKGKWLKLKQEDGTWDDHWQVMEVWAKMAAPAVEAGERDWTKQREASDV